MIRIISPWSGKNAVTEALKAEKPIDTVFVLKGAQGMNQIIALAKKQGIVVKDAGEDKLKALAELDFRQGKLCA